MDFCIRLCLLAVSIGAFFSKKVFDAGYFALFALAVLELCAKRDFRQQSLQFHRTHLFVLPIVVLVGLACAGMAWSIATWSIRWAIFTKYARLVMGLVFIPFFIRHPKCIPSAFRYFVWLAAIYCLWGHTLLDSLGCGWVSPLHTGLYIACIMSFITLNILIKNANGVNLTQLIFFTIYLFLINRERTGPVASIISLIVLCVNATWITYRNRRNALAVKRRMLKNVIWVCIIRFMAVVIACHVLVPVVEKVMHTAKASCIVVSRMDMLEQALSFIQESPWIGTGTGSYGTLLMQHGLPYVAYYITSGFERNAHSHNEWDLWMIQWGMLGFIAFFIWFGTLARYFFKERRCTFYASFGGILQLIFFIGGVGEAIFFVTVPQSIYLLGTCLCIAMIEHTKAQPTLA